MVTFFHDLSHFTDKIDLETLNLTSGGVVELKRREGAFRCDAPGVGDGGSAENKCGNAGSSRAHKEVLGHFKMLLEEYSDEVMKPNRRPGRQKTLRDEGNIGLRPTLVRESDDLNTHKLRRICPLPQRTKRRGLVDEVMQ